MRGTNCGEDNDVLFLTLEGVDCVDLDMFPERFIHVATDHIVYDLRLLLVRCNNTNRGGFCDVVRLNLREYCVANANRTFCFCVVLVRFVRELLSTERDVDELHVMLFHLSYRCREFT